MDLLNDISIKKNNKKPKKFITAINVYYPKYEDLGKIEEKVMLFFLTNLFSNYEVSLDSEFNLKEIFGYDEMNKLYINEFMRKPMFKYLEGETEDEKRLSLVRLYLNFKQRTYANITKQYYKDIGVNPAIVPQMLLTLYGFKPYSSNSTLDETLKKFQTEIESSIDIKNEMGTIMYIPVGKRVAIPTFYDKNTLINLVDHSEIPSKDREEIKETIENYLKVEDEYKETSDPKLQKHLNEISAIEKKFRDKNKEYENLKLKKNKIEKEEKRQKKQFNNNDKIEEIKEEPRGLASKEEPRELASKEEPRGLASKEEPRGLASKEDLRREPAQRLKEEIIEEDNEKIMKKKKEKIKSLKSMLNTFYKTKFNQFIETIIKEIASSSDPVLYDMFLDEFTNTTGFLEKLDKERKTYLENIEEQYNENVQKKVNTEYGFVEDKKLLNKKIEFDKPQDSMINEPIKKKEPVIIKNGIKKGQTIKDLINNKIENQNSIEEKIELKKD